MLLCSNDLKKNNKLYEPGGGMGRVELIAIECDEPAGRWIGLRVIKRTVTGQSEMMMMNVTLQTVTI